MTDDDDDDPIPRSHDTRISVPRPLSFLPLLTVLLLIGVIVGWIVR